MSMKILIADDHPIVRTSLKHVLSALDEDVRFLEAGSFGQAATVISENGGIDLVLLDLLMPDMQPVEGLKEIVGCAGDTPIVVVSAIENRRDALNAIDAGAKGFIPKTASHDEVVRMVRIVLDGGLCLSGSLSNQPAPASPRSNPAPAQLADDDRLTGLTKRQKQVLALLAQGKSNIEIAGDLGVSDKTVRFYISAILRTLKVKNRTQATLIAAQAMQGGQIQTH